MARYIVTEIARNLIVRGDNVQSIIEVTGLSTKDV